MKSLPHYIFTIGIFIGFIQGSLLAQTFEFARPVRVIADWKVINTGSHIGHSGPAIADLNDDGKPNLLVGDYNQLLVTEGEQTPEAIEEQKKITLEVKAVKKGITKMAR